MNTSNIPKSYTVLHPLDPKPQTEGNISIHPSNTLIQVLYIPPVNRCHPGIFLQDFLRLASDSLGSMVHGLYNVLSQTSSCGVGNLGVRISGSRLEGIRGLGSWVAKLKVDKVLVFRLLDLRSARLLRTKKCTGRTLLTRLAHACRVQSSEQPKHV